MGLSKRLLSLLVCPQSGGGLVLVADRSELWCKASRLAYPIADDVPLMMVEHARRLSEVEYEEMYGR